MPLQLGEFLAEQDLLLLGQKIHAAVSLHGLELFHALDARADGDEVRHHAAEPTGIDVRHAALVGSVGDGLLGLFFGADEQDGATLLRELAHEGVGLVHAKEGLLEIENVDVTAVAENVRLHLGVPAAGLMTEVGACIEQRLNTDFRHILLHSLVLCMWSASVSAAFSGGH